MKPKKRRTSNTFQFCSTHLIKRRRSLIKTTMAHDKEECVKIHTASLLASNYSLQFPQEFYANTNNKNQKQGSNQQLYVVRNSHITHE